MTAPQGRPPYLRIALDLQRRISSGELRAGQRLPSIRQLMRDWGVAMATATKAIAVLRQEGWVHTVPGSGTLVREAPRERSTHGPSQVSGASGLDRQRLVRAAIALADRDGRAALSMRRLAAELGVGAMSLYRHVPDKDELLRLMADTAFGAEELPEPGPDGWRAKLEYVARVQWRAFRRHPWLAPELLSSLTHPPVVASGMRHVDWALRALAGLGLDERTMLHTVVSLNGYVGGMAMSRAIEVESERDTGLSSAQRQRTNEALLIELLHSGRFPALAGAASRIGELGSLDELFEFGLQRQLDGIETFLTVRRP